jgi:ABC-type dipeptide/oligopeptide/nickel transport system permease component
MRLLKRLGLRFVVIGLGRFILLLWMIVTVVFLLGRLLPGDPVEAILGAEVRDPQTVQMLREAYGLDLPLTTQYVRYFKRLAHGDLGKSIQNGSPVRAEIQARIPATALLGGLGFSAGCIFGILAGTVLAYRHRERLDAWGTTLLATINSIPVFVLGLGLLYVFGYRLGWLPVISSGDYWSLLLPGAALALGAGAYVGRLVRVGLLGQSSLQYVRALHGFGIPPSRIWLRHLLKNAALPVLTALSLVFAYCLAGNILVENVFSYPGLGRLLAQSVLARDYPVIQGTVLWIAAIFLAVNLLSEVIHALIDPRLRRREG